MREHGPVLGYGVAPGLWTTRSAGCQVDALTFDLTLEVC
jgi:hypothetical protein